MRSKILLSELVHARFGPVRRVFRYPMTMYILDLDEIDALDKELFFFSRNRFNLLSIHDKDYVLGEEGTLREKILNFLRSKGHAPLIGRIELVTAPRYLGSVFNPVSFYYCYRPEGGLELIVAEVNNTVGERHFYVLDKPDGTSPGFFAHYRHPVEFFISPFMKVEGDYEFHFSALQDFVDIRVTDRREGKIFFFARFYGKAVPMTQKNLTRLLIRHPIVGALTFPRILWQAVILLFRKRLPVYPKPESRHPMTFRITLPSLCQRLCRRIVTRYFAGLEVGRLTVVMPDKSRHGFGGKREGREAELHIDHYDFFKRLVTAGDIGFGESYMRGEWDSPNVTGLLLFFIDNQEVIDRNIVRNAFWGNILNSARHGWRRNSRKGSRKNIGEHYDLGNDFYELFLDPTMTYSCGIFDNPACTLERAQENKLGKILQKSEVSKDHDVLEIGCGWGSWAIRAAQKTGCRVTGITLSNEQKKFAEEKIRVLGLTDRIDIQLRDYRDVRGSYDRVVSIEMIEAVGHQYLEAFFKTCAGLLKIDGAAVFQVITIPDEKYDTYRNRSDWIQKHIFPGGMLPSLAVLRKAADSAGLRIRDVESFGPHYARTLDEWRKNFKSHWPVIKKLGFDEVFRRKWEYYFHYCEAGFASGMIDVVQMVLLRQDALERSQ